MNNQYNGVNLNKDDQSEGNQWGSGYDQPNQNQQGYTYGQPNQNQQGYNYGQPNQNQQGYSYGQSGQNQQGYSYGQSGQNQQGYSYGQPGQNQQGYNYGQSNSPYAAPKAPAGPNLFTFALDYIKQFFSSDPAAVLDKAIQEKQHIWSILGSGSILMA